MFFTSKLTITVYRYPSELEEGQCCKPGTVDAYCSWTGTCNFNGSWCECTSGHFWASERCAVYHDTPDPDPEPLYCPPLFPPSAAPTEFTSNAPTSSHPTLAPTFITTECIPGTRGYCHDKGTCSEAGDVCECDDPLHYWPSERCSIENPGPGKNCYLALSCTCKLLVLTL